MVSPSVSSTIVFVGIVFALVVAFILGIRNSGLRRGDARSRVRADTKWAALGIALYLLAAAGISASGVLALPVLPPPLMLFLVSSLGFTLVLALTRLGGRFVDHVPLAALIGFQVFRLPLELVLHRWYREGVLPVQMTYEGYNFDIVSGVLGGLLGLWAWRAVPPRWAVWLYNSIGTGLLLTVITIAVTSSPLPVRLFTNDPPVLLALYVPYSWIITICVAGALFGHVIVFRWLARRRRER